MKNFIRLLLAILLVFAFVACADETQNSSSAAVSVESSISSDVSKEISEEVSKEVSEEVSMDPTANATRKISTLDYKNTGKMGDIDGPAFAVYSRTGYNGASVELNLADAEIQTRLPDGRFINGYMFLGADVFQGGYWSNCFDAGLCWSGKNGGWHIFYNVYETVNETTNSWYESSKKLPANGKYVMTLTLIADERALLTVKGITNNFQDSVEIEVKGAKQNGSNTAMLFNVALDYPQNTKVDSEGKPCDDWTTITLANSDKGLCFRKLHATELKLFKRGVEEPWTENKNAATSIWPDKMISGFDYSPTEVYLFDGTEFYINLDMNRK